MVDENDPKMPWESKTELIAFIGLVSSLMVSFGITGANLSAEQIAGISTILFLLVMIARKYGGGLVVWTQSEKEQKIIENAAAAACKAEKLESTK